MLNLNRLKLVKIISYIKCLNYIKWFNSSCFSVTKLSNMKSEEGYNKFKETELLYLEDTYKIEDKATLLEVGKDTKGNFLVLDRTIFYPQGGGQPSDTGFIEIDKFKYNVHHVSFVDGIVLHYYTTDTDSIENSINIKENSNVVLMYIDLEKRLLNAKAHTEGHLLDAVSRMIAPEIIGKKGYHFSDGPYVEFEGMLQINPEIFSEKVNSLLAKSIESKLSVKVINADNELLKTLKLPTGFKVPEGKKCRFVQIEGFPPVPCGGTHIQNLDELKEVIVKKVNSKKGVTKISYSFHALTNLIKKIV